jgi:rhamnogalacturonan endolyase
MSKRLAESMAVVFALGTLVPGARCADPPVTLVETESSFTLANGHVTARVDKRSGTLALKYHGLDVIGRGYWSQVGRSARGGGIGRFGSKRVAAIRLDPAKNGGARAEVSCKFLYDNKSGVLPADVDLRYALGRGERGLYACAVWEHRPGYPGFSVGEGRMALKLNPKVFDFLTIDARRRRLMPSGYDWDHGEPLNMKEVRRLTTGVHKGEAEHKYDYSALLSETPAYGWSSTRHHVGLWLINPSIEYLSGGPTKVELTGHLDCNPGGLPTLLNMWHGSHYGGSSLVVGADESWTKVIGPFLLWCNSAPDHQQMWREALARAQTEQQAWPYAWVGDPLYPPASQRGTVTGRLVVSDPQAPRLAVRNLWVGLAAPPYTPAGSGRNRAPVDWQRDSKHYQFWARADDHGRFTIRNIRPGSYTLHAFADGVLGEFRLANVRVAAGKTKDLGRRVWQPVRHGRQLWEIGVPNRSAEEFRHGDDYWHWGLYYQYPKEFPNDVHFAIGKSDWRRDWNYCQPPRSEGGRVRSTTWSITFDLPQAPRGQATLRLAICGSRGRRGIEVTVNGRAAGGTGPLPDTGVMHRDGIRGYWCERSVPFDAALLKRGTNMLQLTVSARSWVDGVLYDYLRLELDESAPAPKGKEK